VARVVTDRLGHVVDESRMAAVLTTLFVQCCSGQVRGTELGDRVGSGVGLEVGEDVGLAVVGDVDGALDGL